VIARRALPSKAAIGKQECPTNVAEGVSAAGARYVKVLGLPHLGLNLKIGSVHKVQALRLRCAGARGKSEQLEAKLTDASLFQEVDVAEASPAPPAGSGGRSGSTAAQWAASLDAGLGGGAKVDAASASTTKDEKVRRPVSRRPAAAETSAVAAASKRPLVPLSTKSDKAEARCRFEVDQWLWLATPSSGERPVKVKEYTGSTEQFLVQCLRKEVADELHSADSLRPMCFEDIKSVITLLKEVPE